MNNATGPASSCHYQMCLLFTVVCFKPSIICMHNNINIIMKITKSTTINTPMLHVL